MPDLRLIGRLDHNCGWCDDRITADDAVCNPAAPARTWLLGAMAGIGSASNGRHRLVRDPLGLNKLFWSTKDDAILIAARPRRLIDAGCEFEHIHALPPGTVADLDLSTGTARTAHLALLPAPPATNVPDLATAIRTRLDRFFSALAQRHQDTQVFVCLSGGLDSAGVAVLARKHLADVTAVSFDIDRANGRVSEDRRVAERLAQDLRIPLLSVTATPAQVLGAIDTVLVEAIDWREFNVHAALVNACLARGIAEARSRRKALVLTGDLANEFLVDYHPETYRGRTYYRLPRLRPDAQRAALLRGLDTSHREVGPFEAWGLPVALPYAAAADLYTALPLDFLELPDRKNRLTRLIFGDAIPGYVYDRPKTRAQMGDPDAGSGVLAMCVDRGIDEQFLRSRFAELHGVHDPGALDHFMRGGRYRSGIPCPEVS